MRDRNPKIVLAGERAIESGRPLFVLTLDGRWVPGNEHTVARAKRFIATGHGDATWIYGVEEAPRARRTANQGKG